MSCAPFAAHADRILGSKGRSAADLAADLASDRAAAASYRADRLGMTRSQSERKDEAEHEQLRRILVRMDKQGLGFADRGFVKHPTFTALRRMRALASEREKLAAPPTATRDRAAPFVKMDPRSDAFTPLVAEHAASKPLAGFRVVGIQHLLDGTRSLLYALADSGARPDEMLIRGKVYSQHPEVMKELRKEGFGIIPAHFEGRFDQLPGERDLVAAQPGGSRESELRWMLRQLVRQDAKAPPGAAKPKFLVIDDGGDLITMIHREFPELHDRVVAVEQTTRGRRAIEKLDLKFPVIDVAGSEAKHVYESPAIGLAIANATRDKLDRLRDLDVSIGDRALVVGYGNVGRATAKMLAVPEARHSINFTSPAWKRAVAEGREQAYVDTTTKPRPIHVAVVDIDPAARAKAAADGYAVFDTAEAAIKGGYGGIVVGTTGEDALSRSAIAALPHRAVLINGASSSDEFALPFRAVRAGAARTVDDPNRHQRWTLLDGKPFLMGGTRPGELERNDVVVPLDPKRSIILANRGTVINFDGGLQPTRPEHIQLTLGLLYLGALQAAKLPEGAHGIIELDRGAQASWVDRVQSALGRSGQTLLAPVRD